MQTLLLQENLDVIRKTRANTFNWRGQFTPQLIEHLLDTYARVDDVVVDPFSGSGTVLSECASRGLQCSGLEINPAAYTMSKFYSLANLREQERLEILNVFHCKVLRLLKHHSDRPVWCEGQDYRQQYQNLTRFTQELFPSLQRGFEKVLGLNLLFICEGHKKLNLPTSVCASFDYLRQTALSLPFSPQPIHARLLDARSMHTDDGLRAHLIITSPPYINVFNYHQNYRAILEAVGWDMLRVASSEFGSNRKNRGNRFRTVIQYCLDMEQALRSFWHSLYDDGLMAIVIGKESNVRGMPFYNGQLVKEVARSMEGFEMVAERERAFTNKFGLIIKEDIFVFQKNSLLKDSVVGKAVAMQHLEVSLNSASTQDVSADIKDALCNLDSILPSPVFHAKETFSYA